MSLVKRAFLRRSVLSVLLTAAVITLLVFAGPRAAQAVTVTVSSISGSTLGSPVNFTVTVNVEDVKDLLPIDHINLEIAYDTSHKVDAQNLPLPDAPANPVNKSYSESWGTLSITGTGGAFWGEADSGAADRYGYGYVEGSGWSTETYTPGYGYGYVSGGDYIGPTSLTYNISWTSPAGWPSGEYEIKVLVYGNGSTAFTHEIPYTFTLSTGGGGGGGGGGGMPIGVTFISEHLNPESRLIQDVIAISFDKKVSLMMWQGIIVKNSYGAPLSWVSIKPMEGEIPDPPEDASIIGIPYDLKPDWATFNPSARITFKYNPASIPEGIEEEDLTLAYYNTLREEWVVLRNITVDTEAHTISGDLNHFTSFTVIHIPGAAEPEITAEPEPEPEPVPVPTTPPTTQPEPEPEPEPETPPATTTEPEPGTEPETVPSVVAPIQISDSKGINQWVLAGSVFGGAVLLIGLAVYLFWYRKILD